MSERVGARPGVLTSRGFLAALGLLLLNDLALKPLYGNWLTGKLSDFAGLFVFALFWSALFPRRRLAVHLLTAAAFAFWKSAHSQPLIDAWNGLGPLAVGRTVDPTDLLALAALPLSLLYFGRAGRARARDSRAAPALAAALSVFAFAATSYRTELDYDAAYQFDGTAAELRRKVYHLGHVDPRYRVSFCPRPAAPPDIIEVDIPSDLCFDRVEATVRVGEEAGRPFVALKKMGHHCPEGSDDRARLRSVFEREFVGKLRQLSLAPTAAAPEAPTPPAHGARPRADGRVYFVNVGAPEVGAEELARHFRRKYGVAVTVLPDFKVTDEVRWPGSPNSRVVAERLVGVLAREHPGIAGSKNDLLVALAEDFSVRSSERIYNFAYDLWGRFALVSAEALRPSTYCEPEDKELLAARVRKVVARHLGALYFDLPPSEDPRSPLYARASCVDDVDYQGEDF